MRSFDTIGPADVEGALVLHLAYLTKEKVELLGERAFFDTNSAIDERLLAACRDGRPRGVFVASSGAAALAEQGRDRHLYGMCKLLQEDRFLDFGAKAGVPVLVGRIYNLGGPWINKLSAYAIANMLVQAFDTGEVRINATVPVYRSYLHVEDLCVLVLAGLEDGLSPGRPLDLCGAEIVEMAHVAEEVARVAGVGATAIVREALDYERPAIYVGDPTQTLTLALRYGIRLRGLAAQVADTALYLREKR
jgi:nucleoside-diphosphate-sugar epimerase